MKTKLTREDFEGYKDQILSKQKLDEMFNRQNEVVLAWLNKEISKLPNAKPKLQSRNKI